MLLQGRRVLLVLFVASTEHSAYQNSHRRHGNQFLGHFSSQKVGHMQQLFLCPERSQKLRTFSPLNPVHFERREMGSECTLVQKTASAPPACPPGSCSYQVFTEMRQKPLVQYVSSKCLNVLHVWSKLITSPGKPRSGVS